MSAPDLTRWDTWREIMIQPHAWRAWASHLDIARLRGWIAAQRVDEIWLSGAGSSAYIGEIVAAGLEGAGGPRLRAVASTDIVSRPGAYLAGRRPLVVNFGRSGNSSETLGVLDALDALAPFAPRLNITCNRDGALATRPARGPQEVIVLPESTHDAGFAMTASFTTMLLTALALFDPAADGAARMTAMAARLDALLPGLATAAGAPPDRAVFVGAGPLAFAAREAALKVMELSAGRIPALWDSTLGFRHGPKSFVADGTRLHVFIHPDPDVARYDHDLAAELRVQFPKAQTVTIGPGGNIDIAMPEGAVWGAALAVVAAQVAGVVWSNALGLNVDDPFAGQGTLARVVSGVRLYPVTS
ncbi:MAG: SIS domain-containing protein [Limimaricola sp.]|uniref:SIS domain-containing protein n=1 Tax=Limimaricola sp. TaxID=2211665 RepID=UPI001D6B8D2A|nr:SIS domain-containing protein [Limimaricola sp.]MBI1416581.1 SIS domain-containing protein [Limimaricola sp.]